MNAIIWGSGRIGRGFVADILREGGYFIDFVDRDPVLVKRMNENRRYIIFKADENGVRRDAVEGGFRAHHASEDLSALFLGEECLLDVAVFKDDLESAADMIAPYVALRARQIPGSTMNIITNVNMDSPEKAFRRMLEDRLAGESRAYLDNRTGISGIFMMCISPDAKPEMLAEDPLAVYNNAFFEQAVSREAFRGKAPAAPRLRLSDILEAEEARKLYTLNMAHCALSYLGTPKGYATSLEAVRDPELLEIVTGALDEAATGLSRKFGFSDTEMVSWKQTILSLLRNPYMTDPLRRLGADSRRKLGGGDRLMMPAKLCLEAGRQPVNLARIIRAGYDFENEDPGTRHVRELVRNRELPGAICAVSGLSQTDTLFKLIYQED